MARNRGASRTRTESAWRLWHLPVALGEDAAAQQNETYRRAPRGIERANATHSAIH
ncbi:MAG: hypothetical protein V3S73_01665 [Gammaproteobacteria bacterium]